MNVIYRETLVRFSLLCGETRGSRKTGSTLKLPLLAQLLRYHFSQSVLIDFPNLGKR